MNENAETDVWEETLLSLYKNKIINEAGLDEAVAIGWITNKIKYNILGVVALEKLN